MSDQTFADFEPEEYHWDDDAASGPVIAPTLDFVSPEEVRAVLRHALAACHMRPASELTGLIAQIKASPSILKSLTSAMRDIYAGIFEALVFETANLTSSSEIDFSDIAAITNQTTYCAEELRLIHQLSVDAKASKNPASRVAALAEKLQALDSKESLRDVIDAIDTSATADVKMRAFEKIVVPTTQVAVIREGGVQTALDIANNPNISTAQRFSSGYYTLDCAFTADDEPLGFIALGEQTVFAGATGTGKSSAQYALTRNVTLDQVNQGYPDAPVLLFHTEEESRVKAQAMGLLPGQRFHSLADKIVIENIGSSRSLMTKKIYDLVVNAMMRSQQESRPITDLLPRVGFLDYIQALIEPGEDMNTSNIAAASLILRGFQEFNHEEMAKFSGVDFRTYTGMAWPSGIEDHRMAWVVFVQLKKESGEASLFYRAKGRASISDFTMEDDSETPTWTDPQGNTWAWEVQENDYRVFRQGDIYGSSVLLNNATNIVLLHRSRPRSNKSSISEKDGKAHLQDTRARMIPDKARNGIKMTYVPMAFDVQPPLGGGKEGFRAQYYDYLGEIAIARGLIVPHEAYQVSGDPILPMRPAPSPLAGVKY